MNKRIDKLNTRELKNNQINHNAWLSSKALQLMSREYPIQGWGDNGVNGGKWNAPSMSLSSQTVLQLDGVSGLASKTLAASATTGLSESGEASSCFKTFISGCSLSSLSLSLSLFRMEVAGGSESDQFPASRGKLRTALEPRILKAARS